MTFETRHLPREGGIKLRRRAKPPQVFPKRIGGYKNGG
jgi:hypothetical protein